jgi:hypothetical protein
MKTVNYQTAFGISRLLTVDLLLLACTRDTLPVYGDADRVYFNRAGLADNIKKQIERSSDLTTALAGEDIEILPAFIPAGKKGKRSIFPFPRYCNPRPLLLGLTLQRCLLFLFVNSLFKPREV